MYFVVSKIFLFYLQNNMVSDYKFECGGKRSPSKRQETLDVHFRRTLNVLKRLPLFLKLNQNSTL